ncbi:uncharacterized protein BP5553_10122 [Venustampulla echinocandica]|uniref:Uncharacterized protein n=1 Tax=Venustampulla echinocandica TaxID=2656787 RepID=A0A370TAD3_9HELO|nr:uncharacterized protein BP5553_10122 [Venustampulla echinocandica]RDL30777.1 hypothetical protein BP5553_10122 [Venustampulla echinocandica]
MAESSPPDQLDSMDTSDLSDASDLIDFGTGDISESEVDDERRRMLEPFRKADFEQPYPARMITSRLHSNLGPIYPISNYYPPALERYARPEPPAEVYSTQLKKPLPFPTSAPRDPSKKIAAQVVQEHLEPRPFPFRPKQTVENFRRRVDFLLSEPTLIHDVSFTRKHFEAGSLKTLGAQEAEAEAKEMQSRNIEAEQRLKVSVRPTYSGGRFLTDRCSSSSYALAHGEVPPPEAMMCSKANKRCLRHAVEEEDKPKKQRIRQLPETINPQLLHRFPTPQDFETPAFALHDEGFEKALLEMRNGPACHYCRSKPALKPDPPSPTWTADPNFQGAGTSGVETNVAEAMMDKLLS